MMNSPFFIIGTQRGGTTFFRLMLNMHSQLAIPPESHFLIPLLNEFEADAQLDVVALDKALSIIQNHPRFSTWNVSEYDINELKKNIVYPLHLAVLIDNIFRLQINGTGKPHWGEKTPEYIDIIPKLSKLFPNANFIVLTRDGRDVSASLKNRGWQGWSVYQRARYWCNCINNMYGLKGNKHALFIKYEDIVANTEKSLMEVCSFLSVNYEKAMLDFNLSYEKNITEQEKAVEVHKKLARKPKTEDVYRWKTQSSAFEIWTFESIAHSELKLANYDLHYFKSSNLGHQIARFLYIMFGYSMARVYHTYHLLIPRSLKKRLRSWNVYKFFRRIVQKG